MLKHVQVMVDHVAAVMDAAADRIEAQPVSPVEQFVAWHTAETTSAGQMGRRIWPNGVQTRVSIDDDMINLDEIRTKNRGTGSGTAVMKQLCAKADQLALAIRLEAVPFTASYAVDEDGKATERLMRWYESFGFESLNGSEEMIRQPRPG